MTLAELKIGQDAVLRTIGGQGELRHHLLDMGLTPGTEVTLRKIAPMGDPIEVELRGYELTLRNSRSNVLVPIAAVRNTLRITRNQDNIHPSALVSRHGKLIHYRHLAHAELHTLPLVAHVTGLDILRRKGETQTVVVHCRLVHPSHIRQIHKSGIITQCHSVTV